MTSPMLDERGSDHGLSRCPLLVSAASMETMALATMGMFSSKSDAVAHFESCVQWMEEMPTALCSLSPYT